MHQRLIAFLLCLLLLFPACALAAVTPREIAPLSPDEVPEPSEGMHHYLLLCTDTWDGDPNNLGNTDGVVLVTLDTVQRRVIFCTLTREMLIRRPDGAIGRFTYITKNYGIDALLNIVATQFGIKVDQYAIFCMNNIQDIIDALGGVTLTVTDAEADYLNRYRIARDATTPSMAKAGTYLFSGHAAVIYMRIRKVGGDGDAGRIITGIAGSKDFTVVALYKNMMSSERGFVRRILGILDDYDINFEHLPSGIDTVSVVMSNQSINGRLDEVLDEFRTRLRPDSIDVFENMALIATVGHGMSFRPGVSARLFTALADAGVNIRMIDQGSSEMNIIVGVENKDFETAIRAIYQSFVEV